MKNTLLSKTLITVLVYTLTLMAHSTPISDLTTVKDKDITSNMSDKIAIVRDAKDIKNAKNKRDFDNLPPLNMTTSVSKNYVNNK